MSDKIIELDNKKTIKLDSDTKTEIESNKNTEYEESISDDDIQDHNENLDLEGRILSKYNILHKLGSGMYSIVWLAYNIENKNFMQLKFNIQTNIKKV